MRKQQKETALRDWTNEKVQLAHTWIDNEKVQKKRKISQRGIYWCTLGENIGSEQNTILNEKRPVLIMSNNIINPGDPNVLVAPLSKNLEIKIKNGDPVKAGNGKPVPRFGSHYFLYQEIYDFLDYDSAVMTEALRNVSKVRIEGRMGEISEDDYLKVLAKLRWTTKL